jgi:Na+/citrate or Na+/malate symporter
VDAREQIFQSFCKKKKKKKEREMGFQARLFFFFFLTFAITCFARETPSGMLMGIFFFFNDGKFLRQVTSCIYIHAYLCMIAVACLQGVKRV